MKLEMNLSEKEDEDGSPVKQSSKWMPDEKLKAIKRKISERIFVLK